MGPPRRAPHEDAGARVPSVGDTALAQAGTSKDAEAPPQPTPAPAHLETQPAPSDSAPTETAENLFGGSDEFPITGEAQAHFCPPAPDAAPFVPPEGQDPFGAPAQPVHTEPAQAAPPDLDDQTEFADHLFGAQPAGASGPFSGAQSEDLFGLGVAYTPQPPAPAQDHAQGDARAVSYGGTDDLFGPPRDSDKQAGRAEDRAPPTASTYPPEEELPAQSYPSAAQDDDPFAPRPGDHNDAFEWQDGTRAVNDDPFAPPHESTHGADEDLFPSNAQESHTEDWLHPRTDHAYAPPGEAAADSEPYGAGTGDVFSSTGYNTETDAHAGPMEPPHASRTDELFGGTDQLGDDPFAPQPADPYAPQNEEQGIGHDADAYPRQGAGVFSITDDDPFKPGGNDWYAPQEEGVRQDEPAAPDSHGEPASEPFFAQQDGTEKEPVYDPYAPHENISREEGTQAPPSDESAPPPAHDTGVSSQESAALKGPFPSHEQESTMPEAPQPTEAGDMERYVPATSLTAQAGESHPSKEDLFPPAANEAPAAEVDWLRPHEPDSNAEAPESAEQQTPREPVASTDWQASESSSATPTQREADERAAELPQLEAEQETPFSKTDDAADLFAPGTQDPDASGDVTTHDLLTEGHVQPGLDRAADERFALESSPHSDHAEESVGSTSQLLDSSIVEQPEAESALDTESLRTARRTIVSLEAERRKLMDSVRDALTQANDAAARISTLVATVAQTQDALAEAQRERASLAAQVAEMQAHRTRSGDTSLHAELESLRAENRAMRAELENYSRSDKSDELHAARIHIRKLEAELTQEASRTHAAERRVRELEQDAPGAEHDAPISGRRVVSNPVPPSAGKLHRRSKTTAHVATPRLSPLTEEPMPLARRAPTEDARRPSRFRDEITPEQRHRRRESLQMLRARMDESSEQSAPGPRLPSSTLSIVQAPDTVTSSVQDGRPGARAQSSQFSQDALLFCSSCRGDLIIV